MAKDRQKKDKKKKKDKKGQKRETPSPLEQGGHIWTEATAIQSLARLIEIEALDRYMTVPHRVDLIRESLLKALDSLRKDPLIGCGRRPCPSGYYCCKEVCRPAPCEVGPNPKPPKLTEFRSDGPGS